ncbi:hypothetical protein RHMOL_Rhmol03G0167800 [Rhododendron molle]|uniref:Uncharacterized protein n=3 Tax=Rhododendron molle TaxID=49168 RepID=A0ACC0PGR9_RHOML|nr:hypothetical protein RHMOL_Rhmol03G0167800 [Rhododendron molle]KAI8564263.1 hypothetical protein RHMOL_Rhmol03G0167800 [Rhododendron molle]KAI8564264.1 hypothetical protein RHMOL_Rhmol03G0167800 [Rhododendron molle]
MSAIDLWARFFLLQSSPLSCFVFANRSDLESVPLLKIAGQISVWPGSGIRASLIKACHFTSPSDSYFKKTYARKWELCLSVAHRDHVAYDTKDRFLEMPKDQKDAKFVWAEHCEQALLKIKKELLLPPTLMVPIPAQDNLNQGLHQKMSGL